MKNMLIGEQQFIYLQLTLKRFPLEAAKHWVCYFQHSYGQCLKGQAKHLKKCNILDAKIKK